MLSLFRFCACHISRHCFAITSLLSMPRFRHYAAADCCHASAEADMPPLLRLILFSLHDADAYAITPPCQHA
jgi:hypothetical protein